VLRESRVFHAAPQSYPIHISTPMLLEIYMMTGYCLDNIHGRHGPWFPAVQHSATENSFCSRAACAWSGYWEGNTNPLVVLRVAVAMPMGDIHSCTEVTAVGDKEGGVVLRTGNSGAARRVMRVQTFCMCRFRLLSKVKRLWQSAQTKAKRPLLAVCKIY
jgi:hypothetical protein